MFTCRREDPLNGIKRKNHRACPSVSKTGPVYRLKIVVDYQRSVPTI